jgi:sulfur dioxygenase
MSQNQSTKKILCPEINNGVPEVTVHQVLALLKSPQVLLVDVRTPEEYTGDLGHIEGSRLVPLGPGIVNFLENQVSVDQELVFICRSGGRSQQATILAQDLGFKSVANMIGGMNIWNLQQLPVIKKA